MFLGLSARAQARVRAAIPHEQTLDEARLAAPDWPVVRTVVCDDAPQFRAITPEPALCWVHEGRHCKQLAPWLPQHRAAQPSGSPA
jgi:hypothetical protein